MYRVASWNIRGLNSPYKKSEVSSWIKKNKVDVVALLEVKLREDKWSDTVSRCRPDDTWKAEFSSTEGGWARILIMWNGITTNISNVRKFYQFVSCEVVAENRKFGLIIVYASNNLAHRKKLWDDIVKEGKKFTGCWLCVGDFNSVKDQREKLNGNRVRDQDTIDFRKFLENSDLHDIPANGYHYTWSNNHANPVDRIWSN
ncbi:hypothetical protein QQ045_004931 [Rhodiola kirilowii]